MSNLVNNSRPGPSQCPLATQPFSQDPSDCLLMTKQSKRLPPGTALGPITLDLLSGYLGAYALAVVKYLITILFIT
jgi:hypothetical protein